jgi:hypothetical protein
MTDTSAKKRRRTRGNGSVWRKRRMWWFAYTGPDGKRVAESSGSERKGDAERLLRKRLGAKEHVLPVVPNAEKLTFVQAKDASLADARAHELRSIDEVERRVEKHLLPFFGSRSLASLTGSDVLAYVAHRKAGDRAERQAGRRCEQRGDQSRAAMPQAHLQRCDA